MAVWQPLQSQRFNSGIRQATSKPCFTPVRATSSAGTRFTFISPWLSLTAQGCPCAAGSFISAEASGAGRQALNAKSNIKPRVFIFSDLFYGFVIDSQAIHVHPFPDQQHKALKLNAIKYSF
jgi:hypothetical protein